MHAILAGKRAAFASSMLQNSRHEKSRHPDVDDSGLTRHDVDVVASRTHSWHSKEQQVPHRAFGPVRNDKSLEFDPKNCCINRHKLPCAKCRAHTPNYPYVIPDRSAQKPQIPFVISTRSERPVRNPLFACHSEPRNNPFVIPNRLKDREDLLFIGADLIPQPQKHPHPIQLRLKFPLESRSRGCDSTYPNSALSSPLRTDSSPTQSPARATASAAHSIPEFVSPPAYKLRSGRPIPKHFEAPAIPDDSIERREQAQRLLRSGVRRDLIGRPIPFHAIDFRVRHSLLRALQRLGDLRLPLRRRIAQPPHQKSQASQRHRRIDVDRCIHQRINARHTRRLIGRSRPMLVCSIESNARSTSHHAQPPLIVHGVEKMGGRVESSSPIVRHRAVRNIGTAFGVAVLGQVYLFHINAALPRALSAQRAAAEQFIAPAQGTKRTVIDAVILQGFQQTALACAILCALAVVVAFFIRIRPLTVIEQSRPLTNSLSDSREGEPVA